MVPLSALNGTAQISTLCSDCCLIITKWANEVREIDPEIAEFNRSLLTLQIRYDALSSSLFDSTTIDGAQLADRYAGGELWSLFFSTLNDCLEVVLRTKQVLETILYGQKNVKAMVKHFLEALTSGELVVVKQAVQLLGLNVALPLAMTTITLHLHQPEVNDTIRESIFQDLARLKRENDAFVSTVTKLSCSPYAQESKPFQHMQDFASAVDNFLKGAAAGLNGMSATRIRPAPLETPVDRTRVNMQERHESDIDVAPHCEQLDGTTITARSPSLSLYDMHSNNDDNTSDEDNEIELELTLEYMANGEADLKAEDYAGAEENFRRALEMTEQNDFSKRLDYGPGAVTLMLTDCLMLQEKEEEALELLEPLAEGTSGFAKSGKTSSSVAKQVHERGLQLKASHILGTVFLKRKDHVAAEKRAKEAFKGRRKLLGHSHQMTTETVQLLIDIYTAKDDKTNARAYHRFLEPVSGNSRTPAASTHPQAVPEQQASLVADSLTIPSSSTGEEAKAHSIIHSSLARHPPLSPMNAPAPLQSRKLIDNLPPSVLSEISYRKTTPSHSFQDTQNHLSPSLASPVVQQNNLAQLSMPPHFSPVTSPQSASSTPMSSQYFVQSMSAAAVPPLPPPKAPHTPASVPQPGSPPVFSRTEFYPTRTLDHIAQNEPLQAYQTPAESKHTTPSTTQPAQKFELDTLSKILNSTTSTRKKMSWSNPFSRSHAAKSDPDVPKNASQDAAPQTTSRISSIANVSLTHDSRRTTSSTSVSYERDILKANDYEDDKERRVSSATRAYSTSNHPTGRSRQELTPKFNAIKALRSEGKRSASIDTAWKLLKEYDPEKKVLIIREAELKKNMKESGMGLAGTGEGYAPIHFFCELKIEAVNEVQLLIEQGVNVNVVACKASMPGHDPFTPLQRAIEHGHTEIVRLLIDAGAEIAPPRLQKIGPSGGNRDIMDHPLHIACSMGHTEVTHMLLAAGAAKNLEVFPTRQWHGNSLLHEACWRADIDMVKMLLDYSKRLSSQQHRSGQPAGADNIDQELSAVGSPGQQDQFGTTPIMYAIDLRDSTSERMRLRKTERRKECLKLLLEHEIHGDLNSLVYRESVAQMLSLKSTKGPHAGHSIFCYADGQANDELDMILNPFKYQASPAMRCAAVPQCDAFKRSKADIILGISADSRLRNTRLPIFPELMSTPLDTSGVPLAEMSGGDDGVPPPGSEIAVSNPSSLLSAVPKDNHHGQGHLREYPRATSTGLTNAGGSDRGTSFS